MDKLLTLGIDPWSMLFYLINTGIVLVVLSRYLYKPIQNFIDERRDQILENIEKAKNLQESFEKKLDESEAKRKAVESELKIEIDNLHKFTEQKRAELIGEMEKTRHEMIQKANEEIEKRKIGLIKEVEAELRKIISKIILEIVEHKVPSEVIDGSIDSAWKKYVKSS